MAIPFASASVKEAMMSAGMLSQPTLIDFCVYLCLKCDKLVMGYDQENHVREVYQGKDVPWRRVK